MTDESDREAMPPASPRRRYLAILFSDLSDSARLAAAMETEDFADLLASLRCACEAVVSKHGGTILQIQGDGILASFGYPDAREDDGRRATEAALDLHEQVRGLRLHFPLPVAGAPRLHTGIHSGLVLIEEGDAAAGRMIVVGNAANVAARLSDAAQADEILVSKETLGAESHFFQTNHEHVLRLQGIADPVSVCRVIGRAPVGTRFEARTKRGLIPFVGREAELASLMTGLDDILAGKPRYLAVVAPAGLGKTRLAEEFLARAATRGVRILRGYCESYLSAEPVQPFLQVLRALCGLKYGMPAAGAVEALQQTLLGIDPALLPYRSVLLRALSLGAPASQGESAKHAPESTVVAIAKLFDALAVRNPLVLFIDDWQWADDAARQVLATVRSLDRGILMLVAAREAAPGDLGITDAQVVTLAPFSVDEAEQTISHLLPGRSKFVTAEIRSYAGGNPLFVEELCHSAAHDHVDHHGGRAHGGKAWLDKLIEARVERLPSAQMEIVRTAAVIGNVIPVQVLESITGCREDDPLVVALAEQDLVYPGEQRGTLRFKHGIARDVIYETVGLRQRRALHIRIAETLKQVSPGLEEELYELLAYHYGAGREPREAARYAELAGDKAMAASALDRAQVQYLAALAAIDLMEPSNSNYPRWMLIAQRLALACVFDPSRENLGVLRRAVELASAQGDELARAHAEYWVGYIYYALGESGRAIAFLKVSLDRAQRAGDVQLMRQIRATLGQACAAASDYDTAILLLDEAIDGKRLRRRSGRPAVGFAYTLACKASVLGDRGQFRQAYECFDEAIDAVRGTDHQVMGSILCWRSGVSLWQGRWEDARQSALEAQRVAERVKSLYLYAMSMSLGAYAAWMTQKAPVHLQTIVDATSWLENSQRGLFISLNYGWMAEGMIARKDWKAARRYAARSLMRARSRDRLGEAMAYRALARAPAAGQGRKAGLSYMALAMDAAIARGSPHEIAVTRLHEAELRLACGETAQAAALLEQAEAAFDSMEMTWHLKGARKLRADL